jgi:hypothetical protein
VVLWTRDRPKHSDVVDFGLYCYTTAELQSYHPRLENSEMKSFGRPECDAAGFHWLPIDRRLCYPRRHLFLLRWTCGRWHVGGCRSWQSRWRTLIGGRGSYDIEMKVGVGLWLLLSVLGMVLENVLVDIDMT